MSGNIIQLNEDLIKNNLKDLARDSVEETLNAQLDHEADELVRAGKHERTGDRKGYRSDHYERNFGTTSGEVKLRVSKLKGIQFETAIIERYKRRECSVKEALIEMYLVGVSVRRVEDITETLWGTKVSSDTISNLNQKAYKHIEEWRQRPLTGEYPYVYVDGIYLKRCWGGEIQNVSVLVAIGVDKDGFREILGAAEGMKEDKESWLNFFTWLKSRGLTGVRASRCRRSMPWYAGKRIPVVFPVAKYQCCTVHFYWNVFTVMPKTKMKQVTLMLKAIHAQESKEAAQEKAASIAAKLREMKLLSAAKKVEESVGETLTYMDFPTERWSRIRTNNLTERVNREIRRHTRAIGAFPDGNSALMLICARLRHVAASEWGSKRYMDMEPLFKMEIE